MATTLGEVEYDSMRISKDGYFLVEARKQSKANKPVVAWVSGQARRRKTQFLVEYYALDMLMDRDRGCEGMIAFKLEDGAPKRTEIVASNVHSTLLQTILEINTFTEISLSTRGLLQMVIGNINRWNVGIGKEWFGSILLASGTTSMQHLKERLEKYLLVEFPMKHTFEFLKPYLSSLIGVRETFLPLEKQFQTIERLFERLVAKTTLLEGEKKQKRGERVGLVALLDKKEAQIWVMNEQHKVITLIAFLNCKSYLKKAELRLNEVVGVEVMKIGINIELLEGMSCNQSTFESGSQNLLEAVVTTVCYSSKDIKEKPPDISIDGKEGESILHITHDMDSHLLLQFTNVLLGGISVICGLLNETPDDKEVEIVVIACVFVAVACVSLQLSHFLENAMALQDLIEVDLVNSMQAAGKQCKWLIEEHIGNPHFPGADKVQCMSHVVFDTDMQEDDDNPIEHTDGLKRPRIQTIVCLIRPTEPNEVPKLERPGFGEILNCMTSSSLLTRCQPLCSFLDRDKATELTSVTKRVRKSCGFSFGIDVDFDGRSGGLSIGWKANCIVSLHSYSSLHIDVMIDDDPNGQSWRCTGFYGAPKERFRDASWNLLRRINDCPDVP
ncbi:hypothetical protein GQ457_03G020730 [Hibiscus cannabinus]